MIAQKLISKIIQFLDKEKEVLVTVFERDSNGIVTSKKVYPVSTAFSHDNDVVIVCEESDKIKSI